MRRDACRRAEPQRGFTLVELMVVVAIVAVLAALAVPALRTGTEDEFKRAVRELNLDLMAARSLSLSRREDHAIRISGNAYKLQAVWPTTATFIDPPERTATLPSAAKIIKIAQCADFNIGVPTCGAVSTGGDAELRFVNTGELMSCIGNEGTCANPDQRLLKSATVYLEGTADPKLKARIVIYTSTGNIKLVPY